MCLALLLAVQTVASAAEGDVTSRGWQARIEKVPGGLRLRVEGEALAAATAKPSLSDDQFQGINPAILFLRLETPFGLGAKRFKPVRFERVAERLAVTEVDIFAGREMIARIPVKRRR